MIRWRFLAAGLFLAAYHSEMTGPGAVLRLALAAGLFQWCAFHMLKTRKG